MYNQGDKGWKKHWIQADMKGFYFALMQPGDNFEQWFDLIFLFLISA